MKKEDALAERERIEKALNEIEVKQQDNNQRAKNWFDLSVKTFEFACFARFWFQNGTVEQKRAILSALGSNLTLKDKKLSISIRKPLNFIEEMVQAVPEVSLRFEPAKFEIKTLLSRAQISTLLRG